MIVGIPYARWTKRHATEADLHAPLPG